MHAGHSDILRRSISSLHLPLLGSATALDVRAHERPPLNATAAIWKTLLIAEKTFRRFDAPELLADVANGVVYVDGMRQRAWPRPRPEPF